VSGRPATLGTAIPLVWACHTCCARSAHRWSRSVEQAARKEPRATTPRRKDGYVLGKTFHPRSPSKILRTPGFRRTIPPGSAILPGVRPCGTTLRVRWRLREGGQFHRKNFSCIRDFPVHRLTPKRIGVHRGTFFALCALASLREAYGLDLYWELTNPQRTAVPRSPRFAAFVADSANRQKNFGTLKKLQTSILQYGPPNIISQVAIFLFNVMIQKPASPGENRRNRQAA